MQEGGIKERASFRENSRAKNESKLVIPEIRDGKQAPRQPNASGNAKGLRAEGSVGISVAVAWQWEVSGTAVLPEREAPGC